MTWLSVDLLGTARNPLGRLLLWVVLLLYDHTKPAKSREMMGLVQYVEKTKTQSLNDDELSTLPKIVLEVVKVC